MAMVCVGIDVSKDRLDVHVLPEGVGFAVMRDGAGLADLVARLQPLSPDLVAIEATGGFESVAAAALAGAGLPLVVVNPAQVRHFAKALGQRAKTDPIDAAVIARFAVATQPAVRPLPDAATQMLADLVARRRQIVEMIAAEKNRAHRTPEGDTHAIRRLPFSSKGDCTSSTAPPGWRPYPGSHGPTGTAPVDPIRNPSSWNGQHPCALVERTRPTHGNP